MDTPLEKELMFCTECDDELHDFCFSEDIEDVGIIKKIHARCKKTGRFKGDVCSKLYIALNYETEVIED